MLAQVMLGYQRLRDRAVPARSCSGFSFPNTSSSRCSRSWCTCWWTRSTSATWWRSSPTCSSPSRRDVRDRAQPARLRRRSGVVLHGDARLRRRPSGRGCGSSSTGRRGRCCSRWWRGCSGCAAGRAASACGSGWRAVVSRVPRPGLPAAAAGLILALGGFIFYNTNVLNEYLTASDMAERRAEYERRYGRYAGIPQPG